MKWKDKMKKIRWKSYDYHSKYFNLEVHSVFFSVHFLIGSKLSVNNSMKIRKRYRNEEDSWSYGV